MAFLDLFKKKKRTSVPDTLAVVGLKKALLLGKMYIISVNYQKLVTTYTKQCRIDTLLIIDRYAHNG